MDGSEAPCGRGLTRPRKQSTPAAAAPLRASPRPGLVHYAPAGPAPFVSPRQLPLASAHGGANLSAPLGRSCLRSPPRHTAVTIEDAAADPPTAASATRFRAPPLAEAAASSSFMPATRRRTPSSAAANAAVATSGLRSPPPRGRAAASATPVSLPPPSTALLSSVFLRRKPPPPPQRAPSPSPPPSHDSAAPQVLFFQDSDSETSSQRRAPPSLRPADTVATESSRSTDDTTRGDLDRADSDDADAPRRRRTHYAPTGIEKLGELSREEEAYDFAILLRPSKCEQHLEVGVASTANAVETGDDKGGDSTTAAAAAAAGDDADAAASVATPRRALPKHDAAHARAQLVARISRTGLEVKRLLSLDGRQTLLKVKAPPRVLELGAERLRLRKRRQFDQIWMEFACELRETFADFDAARGGVRFLDSEKQCIVHALLTADAADGGAGLNECCPLKSRHVLKMFPLHKHDDLAALRRQWVTYWRASEDKHTAATTCGQRARRLVTHALRQPTDAIAQYYGERIAFYFAWLEMYTRWLVVPSAAGVLLFALQVRAKTLDHPLAAAYAVFMALWTSAFLVAWKRRAAALAFRWGTLGYEDAELPRPEFYGDPAVSTATAKAYPAYKRYAKYTVTVPLVCAAIAAVLALTFAAFATRDRLEAQSIAVKAQAAHLAKDMARDLAHGLTLANLQRLRALGLDWDFWFYFLITPVLYGLLIPVLDYAFTRQARRLTDWENHPTETRYQSHLILKVFSFRFVHVFASLYYYAFNGKGGSSLLRVAVQLASFMVSDQLWRNAMQTLYPFVLRRVQAQRKKRATNAQFHQSTVFNHLNHLGHGAARGQQRHAAAAAAAANGNAVIHEQCVRLEQASDHAWEEAELEPYDTFEDYTEMLIQFGYVTFFSLAFPLAPLLALANNVFEMRTDAFKLCHAKQRPLARKASGVGVWLHVLQLLSVLAVLTNCLHIAFTTTLVERVFPRMGGAAKVWVVFGVEHAILALKVWMMVVVPSAPRDVTESVRRERDHAKLESARAMAARIQRQQRQRQRQDDDEENEAPEKEHEPPQEDEAGDGGGLVRRRSRADSSRAAGVDDGERDDPHGHGLRAAQAVLEA